VEKTKKHIKRKYNLRKIIIGTFSLVFLILVAWFCSKTEIKRVSADATKNMSGMAWSSNIGWISFNNSTTGGAVDYGVDLNIDTGEIEDDSWAWSSGVGWLNFNPFRPAGDGGLGLNIANLPPIPGGDSYQHDVEWDQATNEFRGWAKFNALPDDQGWVRFQPNAGNAFFGLWGVNYSGVCDGNLLKIIGYAWSSDFGWISFDDSNMGGPIPYGVRLNVGIVAPTLNSVVAGPDECREMTIDWGYGGNEAGVSFEVQRIEEGEDWDADAVEVCSVVGVISCFDDGVGLIPQELVLGTEYFYRVKALGACSDSDWSGVMSAFTENICEFGAITVLGSCPDQVRVDWVALIEGAQAQVRYTTYRTVTKDRNGDPLPENFIQVPGCIGIPQEWCNDDVGDEDDGFRTYKYQVEAKDISPQGQGDTEMSDPSAEVRPCASAPSWKEVIPR